MSQEQESRDSDAATSSEAKYDDNDIKRSRPSVDYRGEIYSRRVPAGKRTYFFDIKTTRSGEDYFLTITESKRVDESRYEKHKIFLYKEDFGKFVSAMHDVVNHVREECLPGYEFRGLPDISAPSGPSEDRNDSA